MKETTYTIKEDEKGTRLIKKETFAEYQNGVLSLGRGSIQTRWIKKNIEVKR
jgi:hypothetical protein